MNGEHEQKNETEQTFENAVEGSEGPQQQGQEQPEREGLSALNISLIVAIAVMVMGAAGFYFFWF